MKQTNAYWYLQSTAPPESDVCGVCGKEAVTRALLEVGPIAEPFDICSGCLAFLKAKRLPPSEESEIYKAFVIKTSEVADRFDIKIDRIVFGQPIQLSLF